MNDDDSLKTLKLKKSDLANVKVLPDDRIFINSIPEYRIHRHVKIQGEVKYPGIYSIRENKIKLADIIREAGGFTEKAYKPGSKIVRGGDISVPSKEFERLKNMPIYELDPSERSYLKYSLIEEHGLLSISFDKLENEDLFNIILKNNDVITIAKKSLSVKVMGAVVRPGLITYESGNSYKKYISLAGGFKKVARKGKIMIIKGGTENWVDAKKSSKIEAGDTIWVPEKAYVNPLKAFKDVLVILGSISAIIISSITIQKSITE